MQTRSGKQGAWPLGAGDLNLLIGAILAEMSPDPIGPSTWAVIPGTGKSRRLTGKSGTSVWVRFALVHGQIQSDWSNPVLVTFP
jgi:hypothetical protein